jgi:hypothetical protein
LLILSNINFAGLSAVSNGVSISGSTNLVITAVSEAPLPAALPLFATGLGALGLIGWRRKRKAAVDQNARLNFGETASLAVFLFLGSCPLLALSRHWLLRCTCPLSGVKQTWRFANVRFCGRYWV